MTFIRDLISALAAALLVMAILALARSVPRLRQAAIVWPFLVLFLASWAGGVWMSPIGPPFFGGYVLPFVIVAFVVAFVMAASAPPPLRHRHAGTPDADGGATERNAVVGISIFVWIVVLSLLAAIVAFYLMRWRR